jgi:hypothetical protein
MLLPYVMINAVNSTDWDATRPYVQADAVPSFEKQGIRDRYDRAAESFRSFLTELFTRAL